MKQFFLIGTLLALGGMGLSCTKSSEMETPSSAESDIAYYTCAMHPSVKSKMPGKCPICSMELIPVFKKTAPAAATDPVAQPAGPTGHEHPGAPTSADSPETAPSQIFVPVARQQLIGVTYATVEKKPLRHAIRAAGKVTYDKQRHWDLVSRVEGYVQDLEVSSAGELVKKGQPLLTIYSPDLLVAQRELVELLRLRDEAGSEDVERLVEATRRRLRQWNVTDEQIAIIEKTREARDTVTIHSPFRGVIQDLMVGQGQRVMMGDHLVDVADLSKVWVWAEFYQDELPMLKTGLSVSVRSASYPGETFSGAISVVDPFLDANRRTGRVRMEIENPDFKLRPEMFVDAELDMDMGEGLAVPSGAILPTGDRNLVFVDKGEGHLEPRFVQLSGKFGADYRVLSGLQAGERVVSSANFLIDAEAKIQGAVEAW